MATAKLLGRSTGGTGAAEEITVGLGLTLSAGTLIASGTSGVSTFSAGSTGLTPSSATAGVITLGGTLATGSGGTGSSSLAGAGIATYGGSGTFSGNNGFSGSNYFSNNTVFGATSNPDASWVLYSKASGGNPAGVFFSDSLAGSCVINVTTQTTGFLTGFYYGTSIFSYANVGSITTNGSTISVNGLSDYRLKKNVISLTGALDKLMKLRPVHHEWINNPDAGDVDGFIAHEVAEVVPAAVTGVKDAVDEKGAIKPQMMDASKLIPLLTAALQEQQSLISALTERILLLEAR
jgi:hypothetical protein